MHRRWFCIFLLLLTTAANAASRSEVVELLHADAVELAPMLEEAMIDGGSVRAWGNSLIVTGSDRERETVRSLLKTLDRPLRNLMISVRDRQGSQSSDSALSSSVTISTRGQSSASIAGGQRISTGDSSATQSVRALEGKTVMFNDGRLVPVGGINWFGPHVDYAQLDGGAVLRARVADGTAIIDVAYSASDDNGGEFRTRALTSQVSGPMGEWIWLGGVSREASVSTDGSATRYRSQGSDTGGLEIKVELLD